jgi:carboxymethylenebutenolidase
MANQVVAQDVTFAGKAGQLKAYVAHQGRGAARPAVIVVQEWWGLDDHIRDIARRLANEGYFAVAPDLYSRLGHQVTKDPNVAGELMSKLAPADGVDDLLSTVAWIKKQKEAEGARIGVIGFCMGGSYAMALPCVSKDIKAAAPFTARSRATINCAISTARYSTLTARTTDGLRGPTLTGWPRRSKSSTNAAK